MRGATEPSDTQSSKVPVALAWTIVAFMLVAVSGTSAVAATHPVASFLVPLRGSHGWPIKIQTRGRKQVTLIVQGEIPSFSTHESSAEAQGLSVAPPTRSAQG
jgi:hypothetical protein